MGWRLQGSKKNKTLTMLLYSNIGKGWWDEVSAEDVNREINEYGDIDEIHVRINSPGGNILEGCAIYNSLKNHSAKVKIYIDGLCASIATVVAMAGDEIIMSPASMFMIHDPFASYISGNSDSLRMTADVLDSLKEVIINAYITKSKLSREEISKMMSDESWFTAEKAMQSGFITQIDAGIATPIENNLVNTFDLSTFKNVPNNLLNNTRQGSSPCFFNGGKPEETKTKFKEEKENMTKIEFINQFPEMYNEIRNEAIAEERKRLQNLDKWTQGNNKMSTRIFEAKYQKFEKTEDIVDELMNIMREEQAEATTPMVEATNSLIDRFNDKKNVVNKEANLDQLGNVEITDVEAAKNKALLDNIVNLANED